MLLTPHVCPMCGQAGRQRLCVFMSLTWPHCLLSLVVTTGHYWSHNSPPPYLGLITGAHFKKSLYECLLDNSGMKQYQETQAVQKVRFYPPTRKQAHIRVILAAIWREVYVEFVGSQRVHMKCVRSKLHGQSRIGRTGTRKTSGPVLNVFFALISCLQKVSHCQ